MQLDFFRDEKIYERLDKLNDPLAKLDGIINWDSFIEVIESVRPDKSQEGNGGRPPIRSSVLFKGILIRQIYHISPEQLEFQINDRATFSRFCGLELGDASPDATLFRLLEEKLKETGKYEELFDRLSEALKETGLEYSKCAIVDATFVDAPRQRKIRKEQREVLKERSHNPETELPFELDLFQHKSLESHLPERERMMSHKLRQTDVDAMWTKKGEETHYGYKNHVVVDAETKLIIAHEVTPANISDGKKLVDIVPADTERVFDDAGYFGEDIDFMLREKCPGIEHFTAKKGQRNKPLTKDQKEYNRKIVVPVRARVEHVFGFMTYCMGGLTIRSIGIVRAKCQQTLRDFAYNIMRFATLVKYGKAEKMKA